MSSDKKEEKVYRQLETHELNQQVMFRYIVEGHAASEEGKLAWVTSGFPVEIPIAMGVQPSYPEQYGAVVGSQKVGPDVCGFAEELGYSQELCSYARASIGSVIKPEESPLDGLPRPQALLACNNICGTVLKWYDAVSQLTEAPVFLLDTPALDTEQAPHHISYVREGIANLVDFLSTTFNVTLEEERLREVSILSSRAIDLWTRSLEACKNKPSPLNCADRFIAMAPVVAMRGTEHVNDYYEALLKEVEDRVAQGLGAIIEEKTRLLWDNIPPWFSIFRFFNGLAKRGVVFPADTYTHAWSGKVEGEDLFQSIATMYSNVYLNKGLDAKVDKMCQLIKDYDLDGFIMFSVRSCKRYSLGQLVSKELVTERTGVPGVVIEGDMVDSRLFNDAQIQTRVDALLEMFV
ncbi:MAG: 2-hydroxyacyl-CoA dehydratase subunit D [Candidatus Thorarchaeota archaeon]|jgi:benzoyl-CoA reductase/2-hydroxyglutaryl-CoA dehydratase subunit BcrC/BadD/HgdB